MMPKTKFSEGEKVLCFHGPLIYEAKCLKVQVKEKEKTVKYFVHYAGWNKNWDEWVTESRVLKLNDGNLSRQKDLHKAHEASLKQKKAKKAAEKKKELGDLPQKGTPGPKTSSGGLGIGLNSGPSGSKDKTDNRSGGEESRSSTPSTERSSSSSSGKRALDNSKESGVGGGEGSKDGTDGDATLKSNGGDSQSKTDEAAEATKKKMKLDSTVESEDQFLGHVEVRVKLPDELRPALVDDWDLVNRQRKLTVLPARVTVAQILSHYTHAKTNTKANTPNKESAILEVVAGLKEYFNVMLGTQLLYKFERPQYADVLRGQTTDPPPPMSEVYGFIHLVRLFVKMGQNLAYTQLDEKHIVMLTFYFHDFLRFMVKNMNSYYCVQDYGIAPAEYQRKTL